MLSQRKLEIRKYITNSARMTKNVTLMDEALRNVKIKGLKRILDQIKHVTLHKKLCLPLELTEAAGRSRTDAFDMKNSKSQLKRKFEFPKVDALGVK